MNAAQVFVLTSPSVAAVRPGRTRRKRGVEADVEDVERAGVQIIEAGDALQRALVGDQLEFLAELVVLVDRRNVDDRPTGVASKSIGVALWSLR